MMVFHFGGQPNFMPRSPFDVIPHVMPFQTAIFASELLWSTMFTEVPQAEDGPRRGWHRLGALLPGEGRLRLRPPSTVDRCQDFGDKLPSQVFRDHVQTCFIDDETGLRNRAYIGVDMITWEADYPHSDSTWPQSPEIADEVTRGGRAADDEIHKVTWENAARWYKFDPFALRAREESTVAALRAEAADVDTTPASTAPSTTATTSPTSRSLLQGDHRRPPRARRGPQL